MLLISLPWFSSGFLFGTDWPGPRRFDFPTQPSSTVPLQAFLAVVSWVAPADWLGKLLVAAALFMAGLFAYRAVPAAGFLPRAAGAALFVVNPFVYGRIHYGQLYIVVAYALLPWASVRIRALLERPGPPTALLAAVALALEGVISPHLLLAAALLAACGFVVYVAARQSASLRRLALWVITSAAGTLIGISYWVIPLLSGQGYEGQVIGRTGAGDLSVYAAVPDRILGLIPNLLGLYGFWAEATGRFTSMKGFVPGWPLALLVLLVVCLAGAASVFKPESDRRLRAWVVALVIAAAIGLLFEMGYSHPLTRGPVEWLDAALPPYRGMRDAGKWAALLGLVYSQLFGLGAATILGRLRDLRLSPVRVEWATAAAAGVLLALPIFYGNGLLYGAHGEIKPSDYPAGWYAADRELLADGHPRTVLFLPWHEYMSYSFVQNQNRVIASPAPTFFSVPVLSSSNPEVPGLARPSDPSQLAVDELVRNGYQGRWAEQLSALRIKYVLLAREFDWRSYSYLDSEPNLRLAGDYGSIVLYRNELVE